MSEIAQHPVPLKMGLPIPNSKLAMWLFLGTEIMFFTGMIGSYIVLRFGSPGWPTDHAVTHINIVAGGVNTFVLICSSYLVVMAHDAMTKAKIGRAQISILGTLVLAGLFLGIKSVEYKGKFDHDIIPGHIAEDDQQAMDKAVRELESVTTNWADELIPGEQILQQKVKQIQQKISNAGESASTDLLAFQSFNQALDTIRKRVSAQTVSLGLEQEHAKEAVHEQFSNVEAALNAAGVVGALNYLRNEDRFSVRMHAVHHPHPIKFGNLFASLYFFLTGIHALHVVIGMFLFLTVLLWGTFLTTDATTYVENIGLYWHFVDLVWIFLFPLIYII